MENIILIDLPEVHTRLLPLTFTRPIAELTVGIGTLREKWQRILPGKYSYKTEDYLSELYPMIGSPESSLTIAADIIPTPELATEIAALPVAGILTNEDGTFVAARNIGDLQKDCQHITAKSAVRRITRLPDLFLYNSELIKADFKAITAGHQSQPISRSNIVIGDSNEIFISEGAKVEGVSLNTTDGPIYIGEGAEVMEGSCLRGPIAICDHSTVNMGTKIYGATTIGAHCKVGGEINNVVMHPYSNKAHDGFLGNAVIGSWCNLGAGCIASNLKNDYTEIKLWDYSSRRFMRTGLQFCGLIMGDHSKAGINTMFNTATVVGVGVNIHGTGFPRNFVASFSEGSATSGFTDVSLSKFFAIAERVMARRDVSLTDPMRRMFEHILEQTDQLK